MPSKNAITHPWIDPHCMLCLVEVGLPGQYFHQVEEGYWCDQCAREEAHSHWLLGWFFRWLTRRSALRRSVTQETK